MPAPTFTVPSANSDTATEEPKIITALAEIKTLLNAGLDEANIDTVNMDLPHGALANATAGRLLIANASGVITATAMSGDVTITSAGVTAIGSNKITNAMMADDSVSTAEIAANSVTQSEMADDSIGAPEIISNSVGHLEIGSLPAARVYHSNAGGQNIPNATATALSFDAERFDTAALHDLVGNNARLTAPVAGVYLMTASVRWQTTVAGGYREIRFRLNGTTEIGRQRDNPQGGTVAGFQTLASIYKLAANDYVEVVAQHDQGGTITIDLDGNTSPEFGMAWLGDG